MKNCRGKTQTSGARGNNANRPNVARVPRRRAAPPPAPHAAEYRRYRSIESDRIKPRIRSGMRKPNDKDNARRGRTGPG